MVSVRKIKKQQKRNQRINTARDLDLKISEAASQNERKQDSSENAGEHENLADCRTDSEKTIVQKLKAHQEIQSVPVYSQMEKSKEKSNNIYRLIEMLSHIATIAVLGFTASTVYQNKNATELVAKQQKLELFSKIGNIKLDSTMIVDDFVFYRLNNTGQVNVVLDTTIFIQVAYQSDTTFVLGVTAAMQYENWLIAPHDTIFDYIYDSLFVYDYKAGKPQFTLVYNSVEKSYVGDDYNLDVATIYYMKYDGNNILFERMDGNSRTHLLAAMKNQIDKNLVPLTSAERWLLSKFFSKYRFDKVQKIPALHNIKKIRERFGIRLPQYPLLVVKTKNGIPLYWYDPFAKRKLQ